MQSREVVCQRAQEQEHTSAARGWSVPPLLRPLTALPCPFLCICRSSRRIVPLVIGQCCLLSAALALGYRRLFPCVCLTASASPGGPQRWKSSSAANTILFSPACRSVGQSRVEASTLLVVEHPVSSDHSRASLGWLQQRDLRG